jgi:hypothetical protein
MYSGFHVNPAQSGNAGWLSQMATYVQSGQVPTTPPMGPDCSGQTSAPNLNLFKTASGLALGTTSATVGVLAAPSVAIIPAAAVPVVGWVVAGVAAIIGLISAIFAHHAAAVARDLNFGCSALPAVNNALAVIQSGVANGTIAPGDAANALPQIYSQFMSAGGASGSISGPGSIPSGGTAINDSPWCNSNCELSICLLALILYWQGQYAAQAQQAAANPASGVTSAVSSAAAATGLPSWLLWGALAFGLYELV